MALCPKACERAVAFDRANYLYNLCFLFHMFSNRGVVHGLDLAALYAKDWIASVGSFVFFCITGSFDGVFFERAGRLDIWYKMGSGDTRATRGHFLC